MMRWLLLLVMLIVLPCRAADWNYLTVAGTDGVPLNVVTAGQAEHPAIVFVHGIGQSHYSFRKQLDSELAEDFFLVAFDLRGHGASGKPWTEDAYASAVWAADVAAVIAATQAQQPVIVAWSYGTLVALDYVRRFGTSAIAGLNLTGALGALRPFRMPAADDPEAAEFARLRELQLSPNPRDQFAASQRMVRWLTAEPLPETEQQVMQSISLMLPVYARQAMVSRPLDNQDLLPVLKLPVLVALGAEDNAGIQEDAAELAAGLPNFSLSVYAGAGHSVFYEQPERFNAELRRFARHAHHSATVTME